MMFLADITWRPGIGDPNPIAWVITVSYFVAVGLCVWAGMKEKQAMAASRETLRPVFWFVLAGVMCFLGFNKQLDLQTLVTQIGRDAARSEGWYERRRRVQFVFVVIVGLVGAGAIAAGIYFMRDVWKRYRLAFIGLIYLAVFIVIRAASFHHIDTILYHLPIGGYWVNTFLELGGIVLVGVAAYRAATQRYVTQVYRAFEAKVRIR